MKGTEFHWASLVTEASTTGTELHSIEFFAKGMPWKSPHNTDHCQDNGLLSAN